MKKRKFFSIILVILCISFFSCTKEDEINFSGTEGIFTDPRDGMVYRWVKIGSQIWMAENLRAIKYNDGTAIPNVSNQITWQGLATGAWCNYDNNASYDNTYGKLYNWYAVNTGKLAPKGWHIPTDAEWSYLADYLGGENVAGGKLKSTIGWKSPNTGATNSSGFSALPGGRRQPDGDDFNYVSLDGNWWSSTQVTDYHALSSSLYYDVSKLQLRLYSDLGFGFSVRCVRDN